MSTREEVQQGEAHRFGAEVLGPILGEFSVRLWLSCATVATRADAILLFSARGGLRLQLAYEEFLRATGLCQGLPHKALMISRLAAARLPIARHAGGDIEAVAPRTAAALTQEFGGSTLAAATAAFSGARHLREELDGDSGVAFSPNRLAAYLGREVGREARMYIAEQASLFERHLRALSADHEVAVVVDTGLYGTTAILLDDGAPDLSIASFMFAKTVRPGRASTPAVGLSVDATCYNPLRPRTALLRYWHLFEAMLEPDLPSVRSFADVDGTVVSNLESVRDWKERIEPAVGSDSFFAGAMSYVRSLGPHGVARVAEDAPRAWRVLRQAVVWPRESDWALLSPATRSHDFGRPGGVAVGEGVGLRAALSGRSLWREGEVARSRSLARIGALGLIESAHGARAVGRYIRRR